MAKERWITVNGNHILIKEGQSVKDALGDKFAKKKRINKGKYEYSTDGENYEDMDKDSYDELEAEEDSFDENEDKDFETDDARPNHTKLNDLGLSDSEVWNMAYQYIGNDKLERLAEELDLDSPQDIPTNELLSYMSDDDIANMMRLNGLDDLDENEEDEDPIENEDFDIGEDDPEFTEAMNKEPEGRWKELTDKKDEFYNFLNKEVGSAGEERNLNKSGDQLSKEWQEALINKYNLSPEEAYAVSKRTMGFANAPLEQLAKGYKKPDDEEKEPNPMDEFSGPDQEGPSFAQLEKTMQDFNARVSKFIDSDGSDEELDAMISDLRKNMSDEEIIKKLATMFKGTIK